MNKIEWSGRIVSLQPRIRLMRSFDERSHNYLGYVLQVEGIIGDEPGEFRIAVGKAAQAKHRFRIGMEVSGQAVPVPDPRLETAGFYKASGLKVLKDAEGDPRLVRRSMLNRLTWKLTAAVGIGVWTHGRMTSSARPVSGAVECRWR
jgi:hypothetical protein